MDTTQRFSKSDLILMLLYSKGPSGKNNESIQGITRLMKLVFLLTKKEGFSDVFDFEPYKMGPFTSEVYEEIESLKNYPTPDSPFIQSKKGEIDDSFVDPEVVKLTDYMTVFEDEITASAVNKEFFLTKLGSKITAKLWEELTDEQKKVIENIKKQYGSLSLKSLLKNIYKNHPNMTEKSEIRDQL